MLATPALCAICQPFVRLVVASQKKGNGICRAEGVFTAMRDHESYGPLSVLLRQRRTLIAHIFRDQFYASRHGGRYQN